MCVRSDRHLLLLVRRGERKSKFLCGFDERHWFVAAILESESGVTGVATAKAARFAGRRPALARRPAEGSAPSAQRGVHPAGRGSSSRRPISASTSARFCGTSRSRGRVAHRTCSSSQRGGAAARSTSNRGMRGRSRRPSSGA